MIPLLRLLEVWPYLPAFRVVAETEHLPTASARLHVTPSALSRGVSMLERRLGQKLFLRRGRKLELNEAGDAFLQTVRTAMRLLDDGVTSVLDPDLSGPLRVTSASQLGTTLFLRALPLLVDRHPRLLPSLLAGGASPRQRLLRGEIDAILGEAPGTHSALQITALGRFRNGVYCGTGHPLFRKRKIGLELLAQHAFVAPPEAVGAPLDDWPAEAERTVTLRVDQVHTAIAACASGRYLAVLPEPVIDAHAAGRGLRRLPFDGIPDSRVYVTIRSPLHPVEPAGELVRALKSVSR